MERRHVLSQPPPFEPRLLPHNLTTPRGRNRAMFRSGLLVRKRKRTWMEKEDVKLKELVKEHAVKLAVLNDWSTVAHKLHRSVEQCKERCEQLDCLPIRNMGSQTARPVPVAKTTVDSSTQTGDVHFLRQIEQTSINQTLRAHVNRC